MKKAEIESGLPDLKFKSYVFQINFCTAFFIDFSLEKFQKLKLTKQKSPSTSQLITFSWLILKF
jgi:hypothetical protein